MRVSSRAYVACSSPESLKNSEKACCTEREFVPITISSDKKISKSACDEPEAETVASRASGGSCAVISAILEEITTKTPDRKSAKKTIIMLVTIWSTCPLREINLIELSSVPADLNQ